MTLPLPSFLRRRLLLLEARRALLAGEASKALEHLGDPCLVGLESADRLRAQSLEVLCRDAERLGEEGRRRSAALVLERVELESPDLARAWRGRLRLLPDGPPRPELEADASAESGLHPRAQSRILGAMEALLAELRGGSSAPKVAATASTTPAPEAAPASTSSRTPAPCLRFHIAVDDAGELLLVHGERLVLGHASGGVADLPLLGDVDAMHLVLVRAGSFHGGPAWRVEPIGRPVFVDGVQLPPSGRELVDGALVRLAPKVAFRYRRPEPASDSALLELLHGLECEGATRVILLGDGAAGRLRFGPRLGRHVVVPGLQADVELEFVAAASELLVRSEAPLEVRGWDARVGADGLHLPCPPPARIDVRVGTAQPGRPPQGFALRSLGPPSSIGGRR